MTKRILILLIAVFTLGIFSSCEGPAGRDGLDGRDGENAIPTTWHIHQETIKGDQWSVFENYDGGIEEAYLYYDIPIKELTEKIANDGAVLGYLLRSDGDFILPRTFYYYKNDESLLYSETFSFSHSPGYVRVYIAVSDLALYKPLDHTFKIVLIY